MSHTKHDSGMGQPADPVSTTDSGMESVTHPCCKHVRELAYFKWQEAGCPACDGVQFWLAAEAEIQAPAAVSEESTNN